MLVNVKTETKTNTPWDATLVPCSVLRDLNRVQRLSDSQKKTCLNFSKGGLEIQHRLQVLGFEHNWFTCTREVLC